MKAAIRQMNYRDLDWVIRIENHNFMPTWSKEQFAAYLNDNSNHKGLVAEVEKMVVGYALFRLHPQITILFKMVVSKEVRRHGLGRLMLQTLVSDLKPSARVRVTTRVDADQLVSQLFLRACGFRATAIITDSHDQDRAYAFEYALAGYEMPFSYQHPKTPGPPLINRIKQHLRKTAD